MRWKAKLIEMRKADLVEIYKRECQRGLVLEGLVARLRGYLCSADRVIASLRATRDQRELVAVIERLVQRGVIAPADASAAKQRVMERGEREGNR